MRIVSFAHNGATGDHGAVFRSHPITLQLQPAFLRGIQSMRQNMERNVAAASRSPAEIPRTETVPSSVASNHIARIVGFGCVFVALVILSILVFRKYLPGRRSGNDSKRSATPRMYERWENMRKASRRKRSSFERQPRQGIPVSDSKRTDSDISCGDAKTSSGSSRPAHWIATVLSAVDGEGGGRMG